MATPPACADVAEAFYSRFIDRVVRTKGTREAETAKLLENTYRHINIALVNEMARFCHDLDIDVWDVIDAASTKPFGFRRILAGSGSGRSLHPDRPELSVPSGTGPLGYPFRFVELAQEINAAMPNYVARRIQDQLNLDGKPLRGSLVILLGVTYKPDIADTRESPAIPLAKTLIQQGADIVGSTIRWSSSSQFPDTTSRGLTMSTSRWLRQISVSCSRTTAIMTSDAMAAVSQTLLRYPRCGSAGAPRRALVMAASLRVRQDS